MYTSGRIIRTDPFKGEYIVQTLQTHGGGEVRASYMDTGVIATWPPGTQVDLMKIHGGWRVLGRRWQNRPGRAPVDNEVDEAIAQLNDAITRLGGATSAAAYLQNAETPSYRPNDQKTIATDNERVITNGLGLLHVQADGSVVARAAHFCFTLWNKTKRICQTVAHKIVNVVPGINVFMEGKQLAGTINSAFIGLILEPNIIPGDPNSIRLKVGFDPTKLPVPGANLKVGQFITLDLNSVTGAVQVAVGVAGAELPLAKLSIDQTQIDLTTPASQVRITPESVTINNGETRIDLTPISIDIKSVTKTEALTGDESKTVAGTQSTTVDGAATSEIKGALKESVLGARTTKITGIDDQTVEGLRQETYKGGVTRTVEGIDATTVRGSKTLNIEGGGFVLTTTAPILVNSPVVTINAPLMDLNGIVNVIGELTVNGNPVT